MPLGHEGNAASRADDLWARGENVENCWARWFSPHEGQTNPLAAPLRTSFSNFAPQSSQRYSNIGINPLTRPRIYFISPRPDDSH